MNKKLKEASASFNWLFSGLIAASVLAGSGTGCTTAAPPGADATDSVAYYTQLLEDLPGDPAIYYNRGICCFRLARYNDAIADFSNTLRLDPGYYSAWQPRADCHRLLGNYTLAISGYDSALARTGGSVYVYNARGYCNFRLKNFRASVQDYSAVIRLDSNNMEAHLRRGIAFYKDSAFLPAALDLQKTVTLAVDSGIAHLWLGNALFRLGRFDEAINAYLLAKEKAAPLTEENHIAEAYFERARQQKPGNETQAILDLNESIAADSVFGEAYLLRGRLMYRQGLKMEACDDFTRAARLGVKDAFTAVNNCDTITSW